MAKINAHLWVFACILLFLSEVAYGSHFRFGHISWKPKDQSTAPNTIVFSVNGAFRWSFFAPKPLIGQTANVGNLCFGGGEGCIAINLVCTSYDSSADWFTGIFTTEHTYPAAQGVYLVEFRNSARIGALNNNANSAWAVTAKVSVMTHPPTRPTGWNQSPVSNMMPIVPIYKNQLNQFQVQATDADGETLSYELSTPYEMGGTGLSQPPGLTVSSTGLVSWDTTGRAGGFWCTQIKIKDATTYTVVDFILNVQTTPAIPPPTFIAPTPTSGQHFDVPLGMPQTWTLKAQSSTAGQSVTMSTAAIPPSATWSGPVGTNPATYTLSWTPGYTDLGGYVIVASARDSQGNPSGQLSFTVNVVVQTDAAQSLITGTGIQSQIAGTPVFFTIRSVLSSGVNAQFGGDAWQVVLYSSTNRYYLNLKDNLDGTYSGSYVTPRIADNYILQVQLKSKNIKGSPIVIVISPDVLSIAKSTATGVSKSLATLGQFDAYVQLRDQYGNAVNATGTDAVTIDFASLSAGAVLPTVDSITYEGFGRFHIVYTATQAGEFSATVKINNVQVKGSPFAISYGCGAATDCISGWYCDDSLCHATQFGPLAKSYAPASPAADTPVTITGIRFGTTQGTVTMGEGQITVVSWADTQIVVQLPTYAVSSFLQVTNAVGDSNRLYVSMAAVPDPIELSKQVPCGSHGDPHFTTFTGARYDYMGNGEYTLAVIDIGQGNTFEVQTRQQPCGNGRVTCNYAAGVKIGLEEFVVYGDINANFRKPLVKYNRNRLTLPYTSTVSNTTFAMDSPYRYTITNGNTGVSAAITYHSNIDVTVTVPTDTKAPLYAVTGGLCGTFDSRTWTFGDGTTYSTKSSAAFFNDFADSWNVFNRTTSIFELAITNGSAPAVPETPTCPALRAQATTICAVLASGGLVDFCKQYILPDTYYANCVDDTVTSCDIGQTQSSIVAYSSLCQALAINQNNTIFPTLASHSIAYGDGLTSGVVSTTTSFYIRAGDVFGNYRTTGGDDFSVVIQGPGAETHTLVDNGDGTYTVTYSVNRRGTYTIYIYLHGSINIWRSPFTVPISGTDARRAVLSGTGLSGSVVAGTAGTFAIKSYLPSGAAATVGGEPYIASLNPGTKVYGAPVYDDNSGTYTVTYQARAVGVNNIKVSLDGVAVPSAYSITVTPGAVSARRSTASGTGLRSAVVGSASTFLVQARDAYDNAVNTELPVTLTFSSGAASYTTTYQGNGLTLVSYTPSAGGLLEFSVAVDGVTMMNMPVHVQVGCNVDTDCQSAPFTTCVSGICGRPDGPTITGYAPATPSAGSVLTLTGIRFGATPGTLFLGDAQVEGFLSSNDTMIIANIPTFAVSGYLRFISGAGVESNSYYLRLATPPTPIVLPDHLTCSSYMDPHFHTFAGAGFGFQATGEFLLAKADIGGDAIEVHSRQEMCTSSMSCNVAVAVVVGGQTYAFYVKKGIFVAEGAAVSAFPYTSAAGTGVTVSRPAPNQYKIVHPSGVTVLANAFGAVRANLYVQVPTNGSDVTTPLLGGICGNRRGYLMPDGSTVLVGSNNQWIVDYGNSWKDGAGNSVFDPTNFDNPSGGWTGPVTTPCTDAAFQGQVASACSVLSSGKLVDYCSQYVIARPYYVACVSDATAMCDLTATEDSIFAYSQICKSSADQANNTVFPTTGRNSVVSGAIEGGDKATNLVMTIQARDIFNNDVKHGGDSFVVSYAGPYKVANQVVDNGNGTYTVTYNAIRGGSYAATVAVANGGKSVPTFQSPLALDIGEGVILDCSIHGHRKEYAAACICDSGYSGTYCTETPAPWCAVNHMGQLQAKFYPKPDTDPTKTTFTGNQLTLSAISPIVVGRTFDNITIVNSTSDNCNMGGYYSYWSPASVAGECKDRFNLVLPWAQRATCGVTFRGETSTTVSYGFRVFITYGDDMGSILGYGLRRKSVVYFDVYVRFPKTVTLQITNVMATADVEQKFVLSAFNYDPVRQQMDMQVTSVIGWPQKLMDNVTISVPNNMILVSNGLGSEARTIVTTMCDNAEGKYCFQTLDFSVKLKNYADCSFVGDYTFASNYITCRDNPTCTTGLNVIVFTVHSSDVCGSVMAAPTVSGFLAATDSGLVNRVTKYKLGGLGYFVAHLTQNFDNVITVRFKDIKIEKPATPGVFNYLMIGAIPTETGNENQLRVWDFSQPNSTFPAFSVRFSSQDDDSSFTVLPGKTAHFNIYATLLVSYAGNGPSDNKRSMDFTEEVMVQVSASGAPDAVADVFTQFSLVDEDSTDADVAVAPTATFSATESRSLVYIVGGCVALIAAVGVVAAVVVKKGKKSTAYTTL